MPRCEEYYKIYIDSITKMNKYIEELEKMINESVSTDRQKTIMEYSIPEKEFYLKGLKFARNILIECCNNPQNCK